MLSNTDGRSSLTLAAILAGSRLLIARCVIAIALAISVVAAGAGPVIAASPEPSSAAGGDPRSSGQGPGFVGDAPMAIGATLAVGIGAAVATYAYVRLTARRRDG